MQEDWKLLNCTHTGLEGKKKGDSNAMDNPTQVQGDSFTYENFI